LKTSSPNHSLHLRMFFDNNSTSAFKASLSCVRFVFIFTALANNFLSRTTP
jgi:hypothetical protein